MSVETVNKLQDKMAQKCLDCKLCSCARRKQKGIAFWLVKNLEVHICPFCKAYEKVYGRKAHEPIPETDQSPSSASVQ